MAKATLPQLEALIRTTGFFRNKAKSIQGAARKIIADFNGQVPQTLAELITIPGAARKTANVVLGVCFGKAEGVVVDTHVFRIARRLGLAKGETPEKVEQELMQISRRIAGSPSPTSSSTMAARSATPASPSATAATSSSSATPKTKPGSPDEFAMPRNPILSSWAPSARITASTSPGMSETVASQAGTQPRLTQCLAGNRSNRDRRNSRKGKLDASCASRLRQVRHTR